jgi:hypothetical protein
MIPRVYALPISLVLIVVGSYGRYVAEYENEFFYYLLFAGIIGLLSTLYWWRDLR